MSPVKTTWTEVDFDQMSWHDCSIWGFEIHVGDPDTEDWTSELALDIDFIVEWPKACDAWEFTVAPATLVFRDVTNLCIHLDWWEAGYTNVVPNPAWIRSIEREPLPGRPDCPEWRSYAWRIVLDANTQPGAIELYATGFRQDLWGPVTCTGNSQQLPWRVREEMKKTRGE